MQKFKIVIISLFIWNTEKRIIIIGKVGAGKSALGNAILQKDVFESRQSFLPVTDVWKSEFVYRDGIKYYVVDTPGVNGLQEDSMKAFKQIARCILATSPGFHCIVLVISASERLDDKDIKLINNLDKMLGNDAHDFIIIVFTGVAPKNLEALVNTSKDVRNLCKQSRGNYLSLGDNTDKTITDQQTAIFFEKLNKLFIRNNNSAYYHPSFNKASKLLMSEAEKIEKKERIPADIAQEQARKRILSGESIHDKEIVVLFMEYKDISPCCKTS